MYNCNQENQCRGVFCLARIIWIVAAALLFVVGAIVGALVSEFILAELTAVIIFAIILAFILVLLLILRRCRE